MNRPVNSMVALAAPDFPIPYDMQGPDDDLRDALALLDVIDICIDHGSLHGLSKEAVRDIAVAISTAKSGLRTVKAYLEADDRDGVVDLYRRVRREEIIRINSGRVA